MIYIEEEGAVVRAPQRDGPVEIWKDRAWAPYNGSVGKSLERGREISEDEALRLIEAAGEPVRTIGEAIEIDPWKFDDYDGGREEPRPSVLAHLDLRARKRAAAETNA